MNYEYWIQFLGCYKGYNMSKYLITWKILLGIMTIWTLLCILDYQEKQHIEKNIEKLTENILSENNMKTERHREILAEYKQIRKIYEDIAKTIKEEFTTANKLREQRNKLLQDLILKERENKTERK